MIHKAPWIMELQTMQEFIVFRTPCKEQVSQTLVYPDCAGPDHPSARIETNSGGSGRDAAAPSFHVSCWYVHKIETKTRTISWFLMISIIPKMCLSGESQAAHAPPGWFTTLGVMQPPRRAIQPSSLVTAKGAFQPAGEEMPVGSNCEPQPKPHNGGKWHI